MKSVKQGVSSAAGSTAVWHCKLISSLSILSWKKRENVSQPSFVEQNAGSCIWWTLSDLRMRNTFLYFFTIVFGFLADIIVGHSSLAVTYNWRCISSFVLLHKFSHLRFFSQRRTMDAASCFGRERSAKERVCLVRETGVVERY